MREARTSSVAQVPTAVLPVVREPPVLRLLERLQELDRLFSYNVPARIRDNADNNTLAHHLQQVYTPDFFRVEDPDEIKKYATTGDRVLCRAGIKNIKWEIASGSEGAIKEVLNMRKSAKVKFTKGPAQEVPLEQLLVIGEKSGFLRKTKTYPEPREAITIYRELKANMIIRYLGEPIVGPGTSVPMNTEGVIIGKQRGQYAVAWINRMGLQQELKELLDSEGYFRGFAPTVYYAAAEVILIVRNEVNYGRLLEECIHHG